MFFLVAGLLPGCVATVNERAARSESLNNLRQIISAVHECHDAYQKLPPAVGIFPGSEYQKAAPTTSGTLFYFILPYIEQDQVYRAAADQSLTGAGSHVITAYFAPSDPSLPADNLDPNTGNALTSFAVNWYAFRGAPFTSDCIKDKSDCTSRGAMRDSFPDGRSNTIGLIGRYGICQSIGHFWADDQEDAGCASSPVVIYSNLYSAAGLKGDQLAAAAYPEFQPNLQKCDPTRTQAFYASGILVALMDGSARMVSSKISQACWRNALTPDGGEQLDNTW
jgi:hypothetical protein